MGEFVLVIAVFGELAVAAGELVAVFAEQRKLLVGVERAVEGGRAARIERQLALGQTDIFRLDCVVLCYF